MCLSSAGSFRLTTLRGSPLFSSQPSECTFVRHSDYILLTRQPQPLNFNKMRKSSESLLIRNASDHEYGKSRYWICNGEMSKLYLKSCHLTAFHKFQWVILYFSVLCEIMAILFKVCLTTTERSFTTSFIFLLLIVATHHSRFVVIYDIGLWISTNVWLSDSIGEASFRWLVVHWKVLGSSRASIFIDPLKPIPTAPALGKRWGTPRMSHQHLTGPTLKDKQPSTLTLKDNLLPTSPVF